MVLLNNVNASPFGLELKTIRSGRDYIWVLTGGVAHIGAVATSYYEDSELKTVVQSLPHHKEGELAAELAEKAATRLRATVTVVAGIHIDNATKEEIGRIIADVRLLAERELQVLESR